MTTTWVFSSLNAMADHLENKAIDHRSRMVDLRPRSMIYIERRARASELESIAYMLRHTELKGDPQ